MSERQDAEYERMARALEDIHMLSHMATETPGHRGVEARGWTVVYVVDWDDEPGYGVPPLYASKADAERDAARQQAQWDARPGAERVHFFVREQEIVLPSEFPVEGSTVNGPEGATGVNAPLDRGTQSDGVDDRG